jgi:hypothetical protein
VDVGRCPSRGLTSRFRFSDLSVIFLIAHRNQFLAKDFKPGTQVADKSRTESRWHSVLTPAIIEPTSAS